ncbi:MAG: hypothetical protein JNL12_03805 [Planctomycetes bacterium]|nr:hypothetical protein [Planctomycetota bacterium]
MVRFRSLLWSWSCLLSSVVLPAQEPDDADDLVGLLRTAQQKLQRGEWSSATNRFEELLDALAEEPATPANAELGTQAQLGLWTIASRRGQYEEVTFGITAADAAVRQHPEVQRLHAAMLRRTGGYAEAARMLQTLLDANPTSCELRHELGEVLWADGRRNDARALWQANADAKDVSPVRGGSTGSDRPAGPSARELAFRGRSMYRLGGRDQLEAASQVLVDSLQLAPDQAEARITLGLVKFAAYGEASGFPSGEKDLKQALQTHVDHEEALLAMYRIRSANMVLDGAKTESFLDRVLERNERCVEAIVHRAGNVLDDRRYRDAARMLDAALAIDPNDRITLCHRAAAAYLLHEADDYAAFRARALAGDPGWPECDRILAEHLCALYRFGDAVPFFEAALQQAPDDVPTLQGLARACIYTAESARARELLDRCKQLAKGLNDPWRSNATMLQKRLDDQYTTVGHERFDVQMHRDDLDVLQHYLLPLQLEAAEVLGARYGFRPERPTKLEVLHTWDDFSVRTIGFTGFTALGACFGRLITLVSPGDADLRRQEFMWEATVWHEYVHVLTLGLSNNRVPRWLTEGFSVYEEKTRDPSWERGMDRELFDAFANQDIPPVHLLNRLFRGPRILFGYYQGGLIVEFLTKRYGFDKALLLLRAFAEDLDTEEAFEKALGIASRVFDQQFLDFVQQEKLRGMRLVPHHDDAAVARLQARAQKDPRNLQVRIDLAWACLDRDNPVDAGRWLAEVLRVDPEHGQAQLVRAELLRSRQQLDEALECWRRGFGKGADDFDSRIACGRTLLAKGDQDGAIAMWEAAKACWPTCTEQQNAPELLLARLYRERGDEAKEQAEMRTWCKRSGRAYQPRWRLAEFEREAGRRAEELRFLVECNRIDPFHRELHLRMAAACVALGKKVEAAREYEVAAAVTPKLDRQYLDSEQRPETGGPDDLEQRATAWLAAAKLRRELGDTERALNLLDRLLREASGTGAEAEARGLLAEWRGR